MLKNYYVFLALKINRDVKSSQVMRVTMVP